MPEHIITKPDKCRACHRCEVACIAAHHNLDMKEAMKRRNEFAPRVRVIRGEGYKTTVRCHQCNPAPCANICPTGAVEQLADGTLVTHDEQCIACEMCLDACPYGAIQMDTVDLPVVKIEDNPDDEELQEGRRVAVRCDLCREWRKEHNSKFTACQMACPVQCIGMLNEDGTTAFPEKPAPKPKPKPAAPAK